MKKITKRVFAGGAVAAALAVAVAVVAVGMNPSHDVERLVPSDSQGMAVSDLPQKDQAAMSSSQDVAHSGDADVSTSGEDAAPLPSSQGGDSASPSASAPDPSTATQGGSHGADNVVDVNGGSDGGQEDEPEQGGENSGDEGAWTGYY